MEKNMLEVVVNGMNTLLPKRLWVSGLMENRCMRKRYINAKKMGPMRDVVGELSQAIRQRGMKFFLSLHHENNYYYVKMKPTWAANNPKYRKMYGCLMPRDEWYQMWLDKSKEVVTKYSPDIIYFDAWMHPLHWKVKSQPLEPPGRALIVFLYY